MNNLGIIIQARATSKRFPNKIFKKIEKITVLEHVLKRVKKIKFRNKIIIASTINKTNSKIIKIAKDNNCNYFFGPEKNVLKRFYLSANKFKIKNIVRISADSPFIDPKIIDKFCKIFNKGKFDVVTNLFRPTYPKGMSVEIFNYKTLKNVYLFAKSKHDKEHVTPFIYKNPNKFIIKNFYLKRSLRKYNFAIDRPKDLKYLTKIYIKLRKLRKENKFKFKDLVKVAKILN
ncbi:MAG: acylneuraminate cytidylyltransferase [Candidatus Pelagibacter sp.]|nr:acylneuraminate cytidylyltransferase [Candidatus Pelagibacter sp.]|tara:strand:- start:11329 stop:12021 length:693 start_codon:yes stop_codon:yes gene_type:complete